MDDITLDLAESEVCRKHQSPLLTLTAAGSKAVVAALKSLHEKIRKLQSERDEVQRKYEGAYEQLENLRMQIEVQKGATQSAVENAERHFASSVRVLREDQVLLRKERDDALHREQLAQRDIAELRMQIERLTQQNINHSFAQVQLRSDQGCRAQHQQSTHEHHEHHEYHAHLGASRCPEEHADVVKLTQHHNAPHLRCTSQGGAAAAPSSEPCDNEHHASSHQAYAVDLRSSQPRAGDRAQATLSAPRRSRADRESEHGKADRGAAAVATIARTRRHDRDHVSDTSDTARSHLEDIKGGVGVRQRREVKKSALDRDGQSDNGRHRLEEVVHELVTLNHQLASELATERESKRRSCSNSRGRPLVPPSRENHRKSSRRSRKSSRGPGHVGSHDCLRARSLSGRERSRTPTAASYAKTVAAAVAAGVSCSDAQQASAPAGITAPFLLGTSGSHNAVACSQTQRAMRKAGMKAEPESHHCHAPVGTGQDASEVLKVCEQLEQECSALREQYLVCCAQQADGRERSGLTSTLRNLLHLIETKDEQARLLRSLASSLR
eukprot:NODE_819_length_1883_cov_28.717557_g751_i0.p1 GENE.NODE_819_length_1883_cov_28.717557_g751_i0~~NODE_819_length_1883_cov_28.717557_g751_i0.p1  ORF type:complete len:554 (+),score=88.49 NODE_819_length_1883_cov_28.717557_g751_i0:79-1740(+)